MTGIERYAVGVATYLPLAIPDATWSILTTGSVPLEPKANTKLVRISGSARPVRDQLGIPRFLRSAGVTAAFFPGFTPPLVIPKHIKVIAQIHDAAMWRYPETLSRGARFYYKPALTLKLRTKAIDAVITSSEAAARDLQGYVPPEIPVFGIPPGVERHGATGGDREQKGLCRVEYALAVGTVEPRKNYQTLLAAWDVLASRGVRIPLKIVGRPGWGGELAPSASVQDLVEFVGPVSDAGLERLYANCKVFVMPSLYEGFGVPVAEAMLRGCECLVSDIPVFREIGGGLLTYVPPQSVAGWVAALESTWASPQARRDDLIARAEYFTWKRCVDGIASVFRRVVER